MSSHAIDAVYENGAFRLVNPQQVSLREGERVRLQIDESEGKTSLALAFEVYEGLTSEEIAEVERVALDRSTFFAPKEQ